MSVNKLLGFSVSSFLVAIFFFALAMSLNAQTMVDPEHAKALGEAAEKSNAAAYVLGFLAVACLGLATYTVKSKDEITKENNKELRELSASIREQTEVFKAKTDKDERAIEAMKLLAQAQAQQATKPCALENEILKDYLKGKLIAK